jgi:hypothetical protein
MSQGGTVTRSPQTLVTDPQTPQDVQVPAFFARPDLPAVRIWRHDMPQTGTSISVIEESAMGITTSGGMGHTR